MTLGQSLLVDLYGIDSTVCANLDFFYGFLIELVDMYKHAGLLEINTPPKDMR